MCYYLYRINKMESLVAFLFLFCVAGSTQAEHSTDVGTTNDYCPDAEAIAPCTCTTNVTVYISCYNQSLSESDLERIFSAEFPAKYMTELKMQYIDGLTRIGNIFHDLKFSYIRIYNTSIEEIADDAFINMEGHLSEISIKDSRISTEQFPFETLANYTYFFDLQITDSMLTWLPDLYSRYISRIDFSNNAISTISPSMSGCSCIG